MANENYGVFGECSSDFFSLIILNMILIRNVGFVLFFWTVGQVLLCPSLQSGQLPYNFYPYANKERHGGRVISWHRNWRVLRRKTRGEKLHGGNFYPLSRVPAFFCRTSSAMEGALFVSKKTGEFSFGKLMVKNCMDAIFDTGPFQSGVGAIWKGRLTGHFFLLDVKNFLKWIIGSSPIMTQLPSVIMTWFVQNTRLLTYL